MSDTIERLKIWGNSVLNRWKRTAILELDPRNPDKRRFLSAWGLLICGSLLLIIGLIFLTMLHHHD